MRLMDQRQPFDATDEQKRRQYLKLWLEMEAEYNTWRNTHRDIIDYIQPNRGEFAQFMSNKGTRQDSKVVDSYAGHAARKLVAAMDTGITSEAREWFTLSPEDPQLAENDGVREYLHTAQSVMFALLAKSNFYTANRNVLADLVGPAIGLMLIEEDFADVWRCTHVPIGQYRVASDSKGNVNKVVRRFVYTAAQMIDEFGEENVSPNVQRAVDNRTLMVKFQVLHIIQENTGRRYGKIDAINKPWASVWLELGAGIWNSNVLGNGEINDPLGPSGLLRESGYDEQPFICPRWNVVGMDAYGKESPGWNALGDVKELQAVKTGGAKAIAKILDPPMNKPAKLANASLLPGALNDMPDDSRSKFEPAVVLPPETVTVIREEKADLRASIDRAFYGDVLFLISNDQASRQPRTAEEIRGQKEERLLQLGGVFARYADEALKKAIGRMFVMAQRRGLLPRPPPELQKAGRIRVDFQNPLVTAQKTIGFGAMQQLLAFGIGVAQAKAAGMDKLDGDEAIDTGAEMLGIKPNVLKSNDQLAAERHARAQQAAQASTMAAMPQAAGVLKDLSSSDPEKLRQLVQMLSPVAGAQATA